MDSGLGIERQLGKKNSANVGKGIMNTKGKMRMWEVRMGSEKEEDDAWKETVVTK